MIHNNERLQKLIMDTLKDPKVLPPDIFDLKQINKVLSEHLANLDHHRTILFALLTSGKWQ